MGIKIRFRIKKTSNKMQITAALTLAVAAAANGDCETMMVKAYDTVFNAIESQWNLDRNLHKRNFLSGRHSFTDKDSGSQEFTGRLEKYRYNMQKWGKRLDDFLCFCPSSTTNDIPAINSLDDIENFTSYMENAGFEMLCGKGHHMFRKMNHAKQILRHF